MERECLTIRLAAPKGVSRSAAAVTAEGGVMPPGVRSRQRRSQSGQRAQRAGTAVALESRASGAAREWGISRAHTGTRARRSTERTLDSAGETMLR